MASIIRIKRSGNTVSPTTLASGELAYSWEGTTGGKLYIGWGDEVGGAADNIAVIGGKYFTDLVSTRISHTPGTLTANSAIIVDSNSKIDQLYIDDIHINGSTFSTAAANTNITLLPGGGKTVDVSGTRITSVAAPVDGTDAVNKDYLNTTVVDIVGQYQANTNLDIAGDSGAGSIFLNSEVLTISGGTGLSSIASGDTITINLDNTTVVAAAYGTSTGVPTFTVDAQGRLTSAGNSTTLAGMTSITVGDITLSSNEITVANTLIINSTDDLIDVSGAVITGVATPSANTDAVNKAYVDDAVSLLEASSNLNVTSDSGSIGIVLASEIFTITGGIGLSTSAVTNTLTVNLDDTGVVAGTYGNTTEIPVITINAQGQIVAANTASVATNLSIAGDSATSDTLSLLTDILTFAGGTGITTTVTDNTVTIDGDDATTSTKGIASFDTNNFTVSSGAVSAKDITLGSSTLSLGSTTTALEGLASIQVDDITIDGNSISNANGNIVLTPTNGYISASNSRIKNVTDPVDPQDAATKNYVDVVAAQGLHVHEGVDAATPDTLAVISGGVVTYTPNANTALAGVGATLTTTGSFASIDGFTLIANTAYEFASRVLVKNEVNAAHNGIYFLSDETTLVRDPDFDDDSDIEGGDFVWVVTGDTLASTGWVMTSTVNDVGTDPIIWQQFSGAGTYMAGAGLTLDVNEFNVVVDDSSIEINISNELQVKAGGITNAMLAGSIENNKLVNSSITFAAESGTADPVSLGETVTFAAGEGIDTVVSNNVITISGEDASDTNKGIASFDLTDFTVTSGNVTLNTERVQDIVANVLVEGEGIDIVYDDNANTITIAGENATLTNKGIASFGGWADDANTVRQFALSSGDVTIVSIDGGSF